MATELGKNSERLARVRALHTNKGRRERERFAFEGLTLLEEAQRSGFPVEEIYATSQAYESSELVRRLDAQGLPVFIVDPRSAEKISDLDTPAGIVAVAPIRLEPAAGLFGGDGLVLVLADLNDPGNAGTLLRSADAFGCRGVAFGRLGADPYHPKVVRAAMGALFRLPVAVLEPQEAAVAAAAAGFELTGLSATGDDLGAAAWSRRAGIVVGNERHGLGKWADSCARLLSIPMPGAAESLNAAIAGSIALYAAARAV